MTSPLVYYGDAFWISPYAFTVFVALREKGLDFAIEEINLERRGQDDARYRDATLTARVPAIRHGDFVLAESSAIVEYLEDAFPERPRLLPKDVKQRARARQILAWIRSDLDALRAQRSTHTMFYEHAKTPLDEAGQKAADKLVRVASALVPEGKTQLFDAWTIADSDLAFMLHRLILNGHVVPAHVRAFAEEQWKRPSVREFVVRERAPYVAY